MLIIIEGADKTGKTTLAKEISSCLGFKYHHFGVPGPDPASDYAKFLINMKEPTVCDRFFYGEMVYGPLLRGKSVIKPLERMVIERLCRMRNALLIHANTPLALVSERLRVMGDDMITQEQNEKAYEAFNSVLSDSSLPVLSFSSVYDNSAERFIINKLDVMAYNMLNKAIEAAKVITGVGTVDRPTVVLVGEKLNINQTWMCVPFDRGPSSEFLNECIIRAGINESELYIVNADTLTKAEVDFLYLNSAVKFVALGSKASIKLSEYEVQHVAIPHPQYWKRFHYTRKNEYIKMLVVAAS